MFAIRKFILINQAAMKISTYRHFLCVFVFVFLSSFVFGRKDKGNGNDTTSRSKLNAHSDSDAYDKTHTATDNDTDGGEFNEKTNKPGFSTKRSRLKDYRVSPEDFERFPSVLYLVGKFSQFNVVEQFYTMTTQLYHDIPLIYAEIKSDPVLAEKFLTIMKRMSETLLNKPLNLTHIIFAVGKHIFPQLKYQSSPLKRLKDLITVMAEKDKETAEDTPTMTRLMTKFFCHFSIREVGQIEQFIELFSRASIKTTGPEFIDISETSLTSYSARIHLNLVNAFAKMVLLLDLFIHDPLVSHHSTQILSHLWLKHLTRVSESKGNVPIEELHVNYRNSDNYRKLNISFPFDDWTSESDAKQKMELFRLASLAKKGNQQKQQQHDGNGASTASTTLKIYDSPGYQYIIAASVIIPVLLLVCGVFLYIRHRRRRDRMYLESTDGLGLDSEDFVENEHGLSIE